MGKIKFYNKSHKYKINKTELTSVTTFIKQFFPEFNGKALAKKLAKFPYYENKGMGMRKIMAEWKETANHGTRCHNAIEEYINTSDPLYALDMHCKEDRDFNKFGKFLEWYETFTEGKEVIITPEMIIYDEELGLAGTIDCLMTLNDGTVIMIDWKTNTNFNKNYDNTTAYEPIQHLPNTKMSKYALQLSTYSYILERKGTIVNELLLVEIGEDKVKEHKIDYLKKEVKEMIKHGKKND